MGYSARYHAASLAAVFLALAVGILIGTEFGGEVLSDTRESLERSLNDNLEQSQQEIDQLAADLNRSEEFSQRVYPALTGDRLVGDRVGILALGGLSSATVSNIETALDPTGAEISGIGVVREPPQLEAIGQALSDTRFESLGDSPEDLAELGRIVGRQMAAGGNSLERLRGEIFSRISGSFGELDQVIVLRSRPEDMEPEQEEATGYLEDGLIQGLAGSEATVVGVEATDTEPSSVTYFGGRNLSTVDNVDSVSGQLALVLALYGAQGSFGTKPTADSLLPDLITVPGVPAIETGQTAETRPRREQ